MNEQFTIEWPCVRNLPQALTVYGGDFDYCIMRVRYAENLKRLDGYGVWQIRRNSDSVVVAQSTLEHISFKELDERKADILKTVRELKEIKNG